MCDINIDKKIKELIFIAQTQLIQTHKHTDKCTNIFKQNVSKFIEDSFV